MSPDFFLNIVLFGGIYIGIGLSLNLILGVMRIINVANGELIMVGAYATWLLSNMVGINPMVFFPLAFALNALIGFIIYRLSVTRIITRPDPGMGALLVTFGLSMLLMNTVLMIFTADYRGLTVELPTLSLWGTNIPMARLIASIFGVSCALFLYVFLKATYIGKAIRAVSSNKIGAQIVGINIDRIYMIVYIIGFGLAGAVGSILALTFPIYPTMGQLFGTISLCLVVLGGMGSYVGLIVAAFVLSVIENVFAYIIEVSIKPLVAFITIIIVLLIPSRLSNTLKRTISRWRKHG